MVFALIYLVIGVAECLAMTSQPCGVNEVASNCRLKCSGQFCNNSYTSYPPCEPSPCEPGCDCKEDYLRNNQGICVFNEDCDPPPTAPFECSGEEVKLPCTELCTRIECEKTGQQFVCVSDTIYDNSSKHGDTSRRIKCPLTPIGPFNCDINQVPVLCSDVCSKDMCEEADETYLCVEIPYDNEEDDDTNCKSTPYECPLDSSNYPSIIFTKISKIIYGINTDGLPKNIKFYPLLEFEQLVLLYGISSAELENEYPDNNDDVYFETTSDISVDNDKKCDSNQTYAQCNMKCPDDYCPINDKRNIPICDPPKPCPGGCRCELNYRLRSREDPRCIVSTECPPVKCTRPKEIWNPCPSDCTSDRCADYDGTDQEITCNTLVLNCKPQCVCKKGFYRNQEGICIPASECPKKVK